MNDIYPIFQMIPHLSLKAKWCGQSISRKIDLKTRPINNPEVAIRQSRVLVLYLEVFIEKVDFSSFTRVRDETLTEPLGNHKD